MATSSKKTASTTKSKTTTAAAKAPKKTASKTEPKTTSASTTAPQATVVEAAKPVVAANLVKKPELIDRIVAESGMKKKDVKPVVEATLAVLAKTLVDGEELQVPPLGKVKINQMKDLANAKIIKLKIRHSTNDTSAADTKPLDAAE